MLGRCYLCNKEFELNKEQEKDFIDNLNYQYFCSDECQSKHKNIMNQFISQSNNSLDNDRIYKCYTCGKELTLSKSQKYRLKKDPNHKCFCSKTCVNKYFKIPKLNIIYYNCSYCNKEFILSKDQFKKLKKDPTRNCFCSKSCRSKFVNGKQTKIIAKRNCTYCDKEFILSRHQKYRLKEDPNHKCFCSKDCYSKYNHLTGLYSLVKKVKCYNCNKEFELSYRQKITLKENPNHKCFCSHKCIREYYIK